MYGRQRQAPLAQGWGVGRHVRGSNCFRHGREAWGSDAEYFYDIDWVESRQDRPAAEHPGEDSRYVWGPTFPEVFIVNHERPAL